MINPCLQLSVSPHASGDAPAIPLDHRALLPLDAVLRTAELARRNARRPDYEAETGALAGLIQALADFPETGFQSLADTLLQVFQAGSAGISLLSDDKKHMYLPAIAGKWQAYASAVVPRESSPSAEVLERNTAQLFTHFERHYGTAHAPLPYAEECLIVPFYVSGEAVGSIWIVAHDGCHTFDAEDLRQLTTLGSFASAAYRASECAKAALEHSKTSLGLMTGAVLARHLIEKLRESEDHYRMRFESLDEGFCVVEKVRGTALDFQYVEVNAAFTAQTGLKDVIGKTLAHVSPDDAEELGRAYDSVMRTGLPGRVQHEFSNAGRILELYAFRVGDESLGRVAINLHDITERKQAQLLAARQADELADLYATAPVGLFMLDTNMRFVRINEEMALLNGLPPEQHIGRTLRELSMVDLANATEPLIRQVLQTGLPVLNSEVQGATTLLPQVQRRWLSNYRPVMSEDGEVTGVHGATKEITVRKLAEEALLESQRFFRFSFDALSGCVSVLDESGTILEVNEAWRCFPHEYGAVMAEVGDNYFAHCAQHCRDSSPAEGEEPSYIIGIRDVIAGRKTRFEMEYSWESSRGQRWFVMQVTRFQDPGPVRVIIVHDECTECKLAEAASRESDDRYHSLLNSIDEGFCIVDMIFDDQQRAVDCRFMEANPAFAIQTGVQNIAGKRFREIYPVGDAGWLEICGRVARSGESVRFTHKHAQLNPQWFNSYVTRVGGVDSQKVAIVFNNITDRTKASEALRQSEQRFRALFDLGPIAMYTCDTAGVIQDFNACAVDLWGREPTHDDVAERFSGTAKLFWPNGNVLIDANNAVVAVLEGKIPAAHDVEVIIERPDGSRISVIANIVPLKNAQGDITGAINCFYDTTERSRLERETKEQAKALADQHRRKDEFLAMLSHELRNPLAPLISAVQLLQLRKNLEPAQQHACQVIERQVKQLKHLIDDLLEISRINTGNVLLRQERVSLIDVAERALESVQTLIASKHHELNVSMLPQPVWLHGDATRLEQVLVNLLTNAVKYTDEGGRIWLSVELEDAGLGGGEQVAVMRVRDNGIGIAAELLPHIFELFTQGERTIDRSEGGLGIGLNLVQQMVELHGGTVKAYNIQGQGSEFVVRLPAIPSPREYVLTTAEPASVASKKCRVLAVDDHVDAVQSLAMLLEIAGHEVQLAYDGPSALEAALAMRPDVAVLDLGLPGMTGYDVARWIRNQDTLKNVVLVALTGYGREADRRRSKAAGFDYHLVKPAGFGELEKILEIVSQKLA